MRGGDASRTGAASGGRTLPRRARICRGSEGDPLRLDGVTASMLPTIVAAQVPGRSASACELLSDDNMSSARPPSPALRLSPPRPGPSLPCRPAAPSSSFSLSLESSSLPVEGMADPPATYPFPGLRTLAEKDARGARCLGAVMEVRRGEEGGLGVEREDSRLSAAWVGLKRYDGVGAGQAANWSS